MIHVNWRRYKAQTMMLAPVFSISRWVCTNSLQTGFAFINSVRHDN